MHATTIEKTVRTIDFFVHDSRITKVIEDTQNDSLDFVLDYPVDWENGIYEKKILRFNDYLNYEIKEIPYATQPVILDFKDLGENKSSIGEGRSRIEIIRNKIVLITTAGTRTTEYTTLELIDAE